MKIGKLKQLFNRTNRSLSLYRFSLPFEQAINFKGQRLTQRQGLWLVQRTADKNIRIGEVAPLPGFSHETLEECTTYLLSLLNTSSINQHQVELLSSFPSIQFALHCLLQATPYTTAEHHSTTQSVPLLQGDPTQIIQRYQSLNQPDIIKLKVARLAVKTEVKLVKQLIKLNPILRVRLDANQQWTTQQYSEFISSIDKQHIDYIEEPTNSMANNMAIAQQYDSHLALDESLLKTIKIPTENCIKALVIKPSLIGDPQRISHLLTQAQQQKLQISISSSFESPIALNQLHHLANHWQQDKQVKLSLGLDTRQAFTLKIRDRKLDEVSQLESYLKEAEQLC